jgi:hypothetical protein
VLTQADSKLSAIIAEQEEIFVGRQPRSAVPAARAAAVLAGGAATRGGWLIASPSPVTPPWLQPTIAARPMPKWSP